MRSHHLSLLAMACASLSATAAPAAPPPGDSPRFMAAVDSVDAAGRHPVIRPERRDLHKVKPVDVCALDAKSHVCTDRAQPRAEDAPSGR